MTRLLIICIIFLLSYVGFSILSQLDSALTINLYDYFIESSFFTFIILYILSAISSILFFKIIFLILDLPSYLKDLFLTRRANNANYQLIKAMTEFIMGEKPKSLNALKKITPYFKEDYKIFYTLLLAEREEAIDQKIKYFQELEQFKLGAAFATKRLAQILYQNGKYTESENYAVKSFYLNEYDSDNLAILIDCYYELADWEKLTFITNKLNRIDKPKFESIKNNLTTYYLTAAKNMYSSNENQKAISYLEIALELMPGNYEVLNFYLTIKQGTALTILQNAFITNPCFEIFQLYYKFSLLPPLQIYEELESLVSATQHLGVFLAIAAYLDLPDKILELKDSSTLIITTPL